MSPSNERTYTADDVDQVVAAIIKYADEIKRGVRGEGVFTPYAWMMQEFFNSLPVTHELLNSLSAREQFGKQVKELWAAHLSMTKEIEHETKSA